MYPSACSWSLIKQVGDEIKSALHDRGPRLTLVRRYRGRERRSGLETHHRITRRAETLGSSRRCDWRGHDYILLTCSFSLASCAHAVAVFKFGAPCPYRTTSIS